MKYLVPLESLVRQLDRFKPDDLYERCALIVREIDNYRWYIHELPNVHSEPEFRYAISKTDTMEFWATSGRRALLVGYFHTHNGRGREEWIPSAKDLKSAAQHPSVVHAVYHPFTRRLTFYNQHGWSYYTRTRPKWRHASDH